VDDSIVRAFERMQEIYSVRDHDRAAGFALDLAREFIRCEAGSTMLITPGKYELYVAAAHGDAADQILGRKLSLTQGIVGFATRAGAVVTVSDPENDPRFNDDFDKLSGFHTRNIVCAPIQHEGKTIGALELINSPRESGFLQGEANVLAYIAGAVGEYIDTSLPSREADFSDKDFHEFLPVKRGAGVKRPARGPAAKPATPQGSPVVAPANAPQAAAVKATMAGTPTSKKAIEEAAAKAGAKKKKKRKR
jgi:signal transduction protein with GAF and PtsI domain